MLPNIVLVNLDFVFLVVHTHNPVTVVIRGASAAYNNPTYGMVVVVVIVTNNLVTPSLVKVIKMGRCYI